MALGFRYRCTRVLKFKSDLHPVSRYALCLHSLFLWSVWWAFASTAIGTEDPISPADREAIESFNRQTELFVFRGKVASSLLEVASREYPPIDLPPDPQGRSIEGIIVDDQGKPVRDTIVLLLTSGMPGSEIEAIVGVRDILLKQSTGDDGRFNFSLPNLPSVNQGWFRILAVHPIEGVAVQSLASEEITPIAGFPQWKNVYLRLHPMSTLTGRVEYQGKGLADAEITLRRITSSEVLRVFSGADQETTLFGRYASSDFSVHTDSQGNFQFDSIPTVGCSVILVRHQEFPTKSLALEFLDAANNAVGDAKFIVRDRESPLLGGNLPIHALKDSLRIEVADGSIIRGIVSDNGVPCPNAWLISTGGDLARSDEFGKFAIPVSPFPSSNLIVLGAKNPNDIIVRAYLNCSPFVPGDSKLASAIWQRQSENELHLDLQPAVVATGRVTSSNEALRRTSALTLRNERLPGLFHASFRFDDDYGILATTGRNTITLHTSASAAEPPTMVASLSENVKHTVHRFADLRDESPIRLAIRGVDGSGNPIHDGQLTAYSFSTGVATPFQMTQLRVEKDAGPLWHTTIQEREKTSFAFLIQSPSDDEAPMGRSGALFLASDPGLRRRTAPLTIQLNPNVLASLQVRTATEKKPEVQISVSQMFPPAPAPMEPSIHTTDADGRAEFGANPFALLTVQIVTIDGRPQSFYPMTANPQDPHQFRIDLGDESLSGKVLDAEGAAAVSRPVFLWSAANRVHPLQWTQSDVKGQFRFQWVTAGEYTVQAIDVPGNLAQKSEDANAALQVSQSARAGDRDIRLVLPSK